MTEQDKRRQEIANEIKSKVTELSVLIDKAAVKHELRVSLTSGGGQVLEIKRSYVLSCGPIIHETHY